MKILITGHLGKVGQPLLRHWQDRHEVQGRSLPDMDLLDPDWEIEEQPDGIVHLATSSPSAQASTLDTFDLNLRMMTQVLSHAKRWRTRVIFVSSLWARPQFYDLEATYYGLSKRHAEDLLEIFSLKESLPTATVVLGLFNPAVPKADPGIERWRIDEAIMLSAFDEALTHDQGFHRYFYGLRRGG